MLLYDHMCLVFDYTRVCVHLLHLNDSDNKGIVVQYYTKINQLNTKCIFYQVKNTVQTCLVQCEEVI